MQLKDAIVRAASLLSYLSNGLGDDGGSMVAGHAGAALRGRVNVTRIRVDEEGDTKVVLLAKRGWGVKGREEHKRDREGVGDKLGG